MTIHDKNQTETTKNIDPVVETPVVLADKKESEPLNANLASYNEDKEGFAEELKKLKTVVRNDNSLLSNLRQVDSVYEELEEEIGLVFSNTYLHYNNYI